MNKNFAILFVIVMGLVTLQGCSSESGNVNKAYDAANMVTLTGLPYNADAGIDCRDAGLAVDLPPLGKTLYSEERFNWEYEESQNGRYGLTFYYVTEKAQMALNQMISLEKENAVADKKISETIEKESQELMKKVEQELIPVYSIVRIPTGDTTSLTKMKERFELCRKLVSLKEGTCFLLWNENWSERDLTTGEKQEIRKLIDECNALEDHLCIFPPQKTTQKNSTEENFQIADFSTTTLSGGTFSSKDFSKYDLTVLNVWTTWCGLCVEEMPCLEKIHENLPNNVNMISLCNDADEDGDLAKEIINKNGVTFDTLIRNKQTDESIVTPLITSYPTTLYIDANGIVVGTQEGAPAQGEAALEAYRSQINKYLANVKN